MIKDYMAIINLAENENDIRSLTTNRPIASIPIGSRYRVIDLIYSCKPGTPCNESIGIWVRGCGGPQTRCESIVI